MRLIGLCQSCRRVKQVTVRSYRPGSTAVGTCSACEDKQRRKRELADVRIVDHGFATEASRCALCPTVIQAGWRYWIGRSSRREWTDQQAPVCQACADLIRY